MPERTPEKHKLLGGIYLIGQVITTGEVLSIYTAYNRNTNDVVGLYVLELPPTLQPQAIQPLLQALGQRRMIQSAHVLRIHDWGIDGTQIYIATDPPRGLTLQQIMDNQNIALPRVIDLIKQLAMGLQTLHRNGLAGLDLRPQLITVDTVGILDRIQIDDIGLRMLFNTPSYIQSQPNTDMSALDPRYAPPEYLQQGPIGPWSDIYQLGILLFTLITGRPPFVGRNNAETGIMQANNKVPRMRRYNHETAAILQELVDDTMVKDPQQRVPNIQAFLNTLELIQLPPSVLERMATAGPQSGQNASVSLTNEFPPVSSDQLKRASSSETVPAPPQRPVNNPTGTEIYAYLSYEQNGAELQRMVITQKSVIIGRSDPKRGLNPDIDLSTLDSRKTISRQHARIHFEETFYYIEDLKSRNKTRLGERSLEPLKPELIQHGDIVYFGRVRMRFGIPAMGKLPAIKADSN